MSDFTKALETELRREEEDFRDLMNDFEFVKELNKELSIKFQDFVDAIPTPEEIDTITGFYKSDMGFKLVNCRLSDSEKQQIERRLFQLKRFRTAAVLLQKDDLGAKPVRYEELFK
jgi:hypothetical protein